MEGRAVWLYARVQIRRPPTVPGRLRAHGEAVEVVEVACPYCGGLHQHRRVKGIIDGSDRHRIAHCDAPNAILGYFVRLLWPGLGLGHDAAA
jgi:hypothetical protein